MLVFGTLFIITQYVRVRGEGDKRKRELDEQDKQIRAYAVLPSIDFMFKLKSEPFDAIDRAMDPFHGGPALPNVADLSEAELNAESDTVSEALRLALISFSSLAESFGAPRRTSKQSVRYGASIMLMINPRDIKALPVELRSTTDELEQGKLRFLDSATSLDKLRGLLILNDDLLLRDPINEAEVRAATEGKAPYPELALPVRRPGRYEDKSPDTSMILPGGPLAVLGNVARYIPDTRAFVASEDMLYGSEVNRKLKEYFCEGGGGENIHSLLSMRIGTSGTPLGVVNFDANIPNFLGDRPDHYDVFSAFLRPTVALLRPAVARYAQIWWRLIELRSPPPTSPK